MGCLTMFRLVIVDRWMTSLPAQSFIAEKEGEERLVADSHHIFLEVGGIFALDRLALMDVE